MAATLTLNDEANSRQNTNEFLTGKVSGQLGHRAEVLSSMNSLWSSMGSESPVA